MPKQQAGGNKAVKLSRERVRQIEDRLKLKLRQLLPEFEPLRA